MGSGYCKDFCVIETTSKCFSWIRNCLSQPKEKGPSHETAVRSDYTNQAVNEWIYLQGDYVSIVKV